MANMSSVAGKECTIGNCNACDRGWQLGVVVNKGHARKTEAETRQRKERARGESNDLLKACLSLDGQCRS